MDQTSSGYQWAEDILDFVEAYSIDSWAEPWRHSIWVWVAITVLIPAVILLWNRPRRRRQQPSGALANPQGAERTHPAIVDYLLQGAQPGPRGLAATITRLILEGAMQAEPNGGAVTFRLPAHPMPMATGLTHQCDTAATAWLNAAAHGRRPATYTLDDVADAWEKLDPATARNLSSRYADAVVRLAEEEKLVRRTHRWRPYGTVGGAILYLLVANVAWGGPVGFVQGPGVYQVAWATLLTGFVSWLTHHWRHGSHILTRAGEKAAARWETYRQACDDYSQLKDTLPTASAWSRHLVYGAAVGVDVSASVRVALRPELNTLIGAWVASPETVQRIQAAIEKAWHGPADSVWRADLRQLRSRQSRPLAGA